jgi:hypothetical protein
MPDDRTRISGSSGEQSEKRREDRYEVPDKCRRYMALHIHANGSYVPAVLANFSRNGILFESMFPLPAGASTDCRLTLAFMMNKAISFRINVKYCYQSSRSFILGAEIESINDHAWFDFFEEIYDFIAVNGKSV